MNKNRRGFTLIEILVTATIIMLLSTIGLFSYQAATRNGRDTKRKSDIEQLRSALEIYKSDKGYYAANTGCTATGASNDFAPYISPYPQDPKSSTYQYCYVPIGSAPYTSYTLCAYLENGWPGSVDSHCGNQCNGAGSLACNYSANNP